MADSATQIDSQVELVGGATSAQIVRALKSIKESNVTPTTDRRHLESNAGKGECDT